MRLAVFLIVSLVILSINVCAATNLFSAQTYQTSFLGWMKKHNKAYHHHEFNDKYQTFKDNMDFIHNWNSKESDTVLGLNRFADLTNEEYKKTYLGMSINVNLRANQVPMNGLNFERFTGPSSIDWRQNGAVAYVKDQGHCGSCWAFATTGAVEGAHQIKTGNMVTFSEQHLVDCSGRYGNNGCDGGLMTSAFKYIIDNDGIATEEAYPYTATQNRCVYNTTMLGTAISGYKDVPRGSESALTAAISKQPVAVAIDASPITFQLYKSGVYQEATCSSYRLNHGVLAVGYGTLEGKDYYIVKNSWAETWGNQGYILMARNANNHCGIATMASYASV
ncbi:hypothetical protein DICPUDRAFT_98747 [Dictyostelium purpureum]|uniref:Uncharacterized protein n=1 Tax=Dictyostelium purpureum TaxID=5786 RepID=F0ZT74_DICPU|nr:uncharacterized protein DICPUDRAFT_98747 [Dictyostelium purpureum]EGC32858.1 hypothetical protein DICPUDRAFT_98747 [Dictyostelium purpureum]|eukprot:XP_003290610.1 hypothetical protein DICPUDRAFT_98747 [Dictyostelium purpureum]